jgi:membrane protein DedA with SNARE-associated domain
VDHFLEQYGYFAIFFVAFLESICVPFPAEVTFSFTASLAARGRDGFHLLPIIVVGVAGEVCGSIVAYLIARYGGRTVVERYGRYVLLTPGDLDRAERFMAKHGDPAVLIGRTVPLLRAFVSIVAGLGEMRFWRFVVFSAIGTAIFGTTLAVLGYELGTEWQRLERTLGWAGLALGIVIGVVLVLGLIHRIRNVRAGRPADASEPS